MAPWTRELMVAVVRNVRFGLYVVHRDERLVLDWLCDIKKVKVENRSGFLQNFHFV